MEKRQVDIYYYCKRSRLRKGILKESVDFVGEEWQDIIRFVLTRWLSLELFCKEVSKKYKELQFMFQSRPNDSNKEDSGMAESKKQVEARFARFKKAFAGPLTEAYIEFFISVILLFTSYKLFFQRSDPLAHLLYQGFNTQKQPSIGVFIKRCSENIPQIYRSVITCQSVILIKLKRMKRITFVGSPHWVKTHDHFS